MDIQAVCALVIAVVAAAWLVHRWRTRGFDDDAHGCSGCELPVRAEKRAGPADGKSPPAGPMTIVRRESPKRRVTRP